ncbi:MAG: hypothetical protein IT427_00600 [Pirellulales bacterium]|nr:hypothetical protein [Pirellulales bacterium]
MPRGDAKSAIVSGYFPNRLHEFVWRNWNAVEPADLAKVLNTSVDDVTAIAVSMGLPAQPIVPPEMKTRGYVTLIRRNWHLLPYDQLLTLLDMTAEQLAFALREDDFLFVKLGSIKPQCEPLRYQAPDRAAQRRATEIRRLVEAEFGEQLRRPAEPRFDFVRQLSSLPLEMSAPSPETDHVISLRFVYSYLAVYGDPLMKPELDPYPDGLLRRLADVGVNGIWLHAVLREIAPGGKDFPEFGAGHAQRLANLQNLVARAKKFGIGVYLYLNEPRAMPNSFFEGRPEMAGVRQDEFTALCTSNPQVRQWMSDALSYVFHEVPDLGGIYAITASENLTNCASLGDVRTCERCKTRSDTDIISEVVATLEAGVHRSSPTAKVIVSDWGWKGHGDSREIIARLPESVWLMSVSEWSLPIERGGVKTKVGEYTMSAVGPGPRAIQHWETARREGLSVAAEVQFNNSTEIASLPFIPIMDLVAEHCKNLAAAKLNGMMIGWTMGGYPSPNFELAKRFNRTPAPDIAASLDQFALDRFGSEGAANARHAWTQMSDAYRQFPFHLNVAYTAPMQQGPANPIYAQKTGYRATMWGIPYDDLDLWRGPYPREVFASQFEKMAAMWRPGIMELNQAVEKAPAHRRDEVRADLRYAQAAAIKFQSVANQASLIIARDALADSSKPLTADERQHMIAGSKCRLESEISLAHELFTLTQEDSRIGFEPSCQYFYLPLDLVEKVINCRWLLDRLDKERVDQSTESTSK